MGPKRIDIEVIYSDYTRKEYFTGLNSMLNWAKNTRHSPLVKWAIIVGCDDDAAFSALSDIAGTKGYESLSVVKAKSKSAIWSYRTRGVYARPIGTK